jgi:enoyl-CoA hydratase
MVDDLVRYRVERAVATLTLDSPANRNALSAALVDGLWRHLRAAADDDSVRAVVLDHTGPAFCAGADLTEMTAEGGPQRGTARLLELLRLIVELPKPVAALVDGHTRAGGIGIVGACDVAVAGANATFAFTEARLGLSPAIISLTTLPRLTSRAAARYFLSGETIGATTAADIGLVTTAADDAAAALEPMLQAFRLASPQGLAASKRLTTAAIRAGLANRGSELQEESARLFASEQAREGMTAFLEKRTPSWVER